MRRLVPFVPLLLALSGCASLGLSSDPADDFILNKRLAEAYANPEYALRRERAPLVMRSGHAVDNCVAYLQAGGYQAVAADVNSRITPAQYLECDTLAALKDARPLGEDDYRPDSYGEALRDRLDLRAFRSSVTDRLDAETHTVAALEGVRKRVTEHGVLVDARDWVLQLQAVAAVHLDGNDRPDWLIWLRDESNSGLYRSYRLLVIRNVTEDGALRAEDYQP